MSRLFIAGATRLSTLASFIRRILGAPDYDCYLAHMRAHHPNAPLLAHREFYKSQVERRYNRPGSRCC
jgi:uncharacterized short protein YbdD (DUF466 family)